MLEEEQETRGQFVPHSIWRCGRDSTEKMVHTEVRVIVIEARTSSHGPLFALMFEIERVNIETWRLSTDLHTPP